MLLTLNEASEKFNRKIETLRLAIKKKRLKACLQEGKYYIDAKDIEEYLGNCYIRRPLLKDGEITISQAEKKFEVKLQRLYYLVRRGTLKYKRIPKCGYVIKEGDLMGLFPIRKIKPPKLRRILPQKQKTS